MGGESEGKKTETRKRKRKPRKKKEKRTGQPRAHGLRVLARPPQGLDFEFGALEFADSHLVVDHGIKGATVAAALPSCRQYGGGEEGWEEVRVPEDAPRGWAEGSLEGIHYVVVLVVVIFRFCVYCSRVWERVECWLGRSSRICKLLCEISLTLGRTIISRVRCRHRLPRPV